MAQTALLTLDAVNAAMARSWLKNGHKLFTEVYQRFRIMAGLEKQKPAHRPTSAKANRRQLAERLVMMGAGQR